VRRVALAVAAFVVALAAVDAGAPAAAGDAAPLTVAEVAPGVFVHQAPYALIAPANRGDIANVGFVVGEAAVAVVDSGGSPAVGRALLAAIRARTDKPIRYVVNTHVHPDHLLGNEAFRGEGTAFVGHRKLARALAARAPFYLDQAARQLAPADAAGIELVPPDIAVDGMLRLDLGGRALVLEAHPTAHTDADLTVLDEATGTWFLGDLLFVGHLPTLDGSLTGWLAEMDRLAARQVAHVVPGHGPLDLGWPAALAPQRRYLERLAAGVRREIAAGRSIAQAAEEVGIEERDAWALFETFNPHNVTAAYQELEWE